MYNAVFDTNVRGTFLCLRHELRVMTEQGFGSIVNLSSTFGERGGAGAASYSASKHAVNGFTRSAALEVAAKGIPVNAAAATFVSKLVSTPAGHNPRRVYDRDCHPLSPFSQGVARAAPGVRRRCDRLVGAGRSAAPKARLVPLEPWCRPADRI